MRQLVDRRIGARRRDPWDEPRAPVVTDRNPWDDYNEEFEEEFDEYQVRGFSDTDLMDAEGVQG